MDLISICVACGSRVARSEAGLSCGACPARFPIVGGVPVMVDAAAALVFAAKKQVLGEWARLASDQALDAASTLSPERRARASLALEARSTNQALLERIASPILRGVSVPEEDRASLPVPTDAGWDLTSLLPYFHADWAPSGGSRAASDAIVAKAPLCRDPDTALVLGCGAGRLLLDLSPRFRAVLGVDLSLPGLLLARHLLQGGRAEVSLERAGWRPASLAGPVHPPSNIALAAARSEHLPLLDASASFVVTQYLLDIVPDPARVAREIHRVLGPDGIWVNFGLPFRLPDDPPEPGAWTEEDADTLASAFGFSCLGAVRHVHRHLDLGALDPSTPAATHSVVLSTFRRDASLRHDPVRLATEAWARGHRDPLLALVPSTARGRSLTTSVSTRVFAGGTEVVHELGWREGERRVAVDPRVALYCAEVWRLVDGVRSVGELLGLAQERLGEAHAEALLVQALQWLDAQGLVRLDVRRYGAAPAS